MIEFIQSIIILYNYFFNVVLSRCFLNADNNFIWAIIAPFIVILLANITFFTITIRIMWHHQLKQTQKTKVQMVRSWLRSAVSLVVIMSFTWIIGIMVLNVEALLPLVYIYTIMVALQGFFIFLMFVVFSKSVRNAYKKWWNLKFSQLDWYQKYFKWKNQPTKKFKLAQRMVSFYYIFSLSLAQLW